MVSPGARLTRSPPGATESTRSPGVEEKGEYLFEYIKSWWEESRKPEQRDAWVWGGMAHSPASTESHGAYATNRQNGEGS